MTKVVRNKKTGKFVHLDWDAGESFETATPDEATFFNKKRDDMEDHQILDIVKEYYYDDPEPDLELLEAQINIDISKNFP